MAWYSKYLQVFEKPFVETNTQLVQEISKKVTRLQSDEPLVSIVIIAHNESTRLLSCIWSLVDNKYDYPIEIIGVNNCSTDNTKTVYEYLGVTCFTENRPGPGYARQCGLDHARGKYYVCIDADSMYPPTYVRTMISALCKPSVVAVFSLWSFIPNEKNTKLKLFIYELMRDIHLWIQALKRPELSVRGMAFAFDTSLAKDIGFRTDIRRGEDGSLLLELKKQGRVKFILDRKARIVTSSGTLNMDGSLLVSLGRRVSKTFGSLSNYFTKQVKYRDEDSNKL
ncbi:MAG: hypothetical protein RL662_1168 [Bacteroidota bacterium]|jgi:glycosyltransferase involved in cell wall biosynthesis